MLGKLTKICVFFAMAAIPASLSAQNQISDPERAVSKTVASDQQIQCERMVLNRKNINEFFKNVAVVKRTRKTEWITFQSYFDENLPRINKALRDGPFGCDRFYLQIPLDWTYSAERGAVEFDNLGYAIDGRLTLSNFSSATTQPLERIRRASILSQSINPEGSEPYSEGAQTHKVGFDYAWEWSEITITETNPTRINRCVRKLASISDEPFSTLRHWCSTETQRWAVAFLDPTWREHGKDAKGFTFTSNDFSLPVDQAKKAREDGLFLYLGFRLAADGYETSTQKHQIHSTLEEAFIAGREPDTPLFCSAFIPEPKEYVLNKPSNTCVEGEKTAIVEEVDWSPLPPKIQHWVSLDQGWSYGSREKVINQVWRRLKRRADGVLDNYKPHLHSAGLARETRLVVGPFIDADEARAFAALLADKKIDAATLEFRIESPIRSVDRTTFEVRERPRRPSRYGPKITPFIPSN